MLTFFVTPSPLPPSVPSALQGQPVLSCGHRKRKLIDRQLPSIEYDVIKDVFEFIHLQSSMFEFNLEYINGEYVMTNACGIVLKVSKYF